MAKEVMLIINSMNKTYRYVLGDNAMSFVLQMAYMVIDINESVEKQEKIKEFISLYEKLSITLQLAMDLHTIDAKKMGETARLLASVGEQAQKWHTYVRNKDKDKPFACK